MHTLTRLAALAALGTAPLAAPAAAVYTQAWSDVALMVSSQAGFSKAYDDFSLAQATTLTGLQWTGYFLNPAQVLETGYLVELWSDAGGAPGAARLAGWTVDNAVATAVPSVLADVLAYTYALDLPEAFQAAAGVTYWLSIQATTPAFPQWSWAAGAGGDGASYQSSTFDTARRGWDLAFSLTAAETTVPEPTGLALAGWALLAAFGARRAGAAGRAAS